MAYASQSGRAKTSATNPEAFGVCDRCGIWYNHVKLRWQYDWRGATIQNLRILVCDTCYDTPQEQLRAIVVPADPTPIINARTQDFVGAETNYQTITQPPTIDPNTGIPIPGTTTLQTQDGLDLLTQPIGLPNGVDQSAIPPLQGVTHYNVALPVLSVSSNGTTIISVTCSSPHGLSTNAQVSIQGLNNNKADGFYQVNVTTATAFNYEVAVTIPAASLLKSTSRLTTANIGLPYNFNQVPQTGVPNG